MDKLNPTFQDTPVTPQDAASPSAWYTSESTAGVFTAAEVGWLHAQGWKTTTIVTQGGISTYFLSRRIIRPEAVLQSLVQSYTAAYNEGRQLNDQRYDDLLVLYLSILDKTEDELNDDASSNTTHQAAIEALIAQMQAAYAAYATEIGGDLDAWGTSLTTEVNARFDAESAKAQQALIDRGLYSGVMWTTVSAGVERERTRALNDTSDKITQRRIELETRVYNEGAEMRSRIMSAYERLRAFLSGTLDRQLALRNAAAEALGRLVERREDSYPDLSEVGRLAAALGAGSPEAFSP